MPNSGQKLERLAYRLEKWDPDFRAYLTHLDAKKPVVVGGDLNVGHLDQAGRREEGNGGGGGRERPFTLHVGL